MNRSVAPWIILLVLLSSPSCKKGGEGTLWSEGAFSINDSRYQPKSYVELKHPEWTRKATIYEVNIRQYTPEGTFKAFESHLPRLKAMGIDILWIMPVHPIGEKQRQGTLGSMYAVRDYFDVNPEFGTLEDFKDLVDKIHGMGMYVILDWVAHYASLDNVLAEEHPDWFLQGKSSDFRSTPWSNGEDIVDLDYSKPGLRRYMTEAMKFWVAEADIDGFRCDAAGFIPLDFWENTRRELDKVKKIFMLAEWESRDLHARAFDMTYASSLWSSLHRITTSGEKLSSLKSYFIQDVNGFPADGYRMTFTDNHAKNAQEGNQFTYFGQGIQPAIILAATVSGMPLVYSGQEAGLDRSLSLVEKDSINWKLHVHEQLFTRLFQLKHTNPALFNGAEGGKMHQVHHNQPEKISAFYREKGTNQVFPVLNFSPEQVQVALSQPEVKGNYRELFSEKNWKLTGQDTLVLPPWSYLVFYR